MLEMTSVTLSAAPAGAVSVSVSTVRLPSRQPATQISRATMTAAAESAQGYPSVTAIKPTIAGTNSGDVPGFFIQPYKRIDAIAVGKTEVEEDQIGLMFVK
jgi:hypothetical protein